MGLGNPQGVGHGAIGHLDSLNRTKGAGGYAAPADSTLFEITADLGFSLKAFLTWFDTEADIWLHVIGPTPSIGGAIPKLLVSIPSPVDAHLITRCALRDWPLNRCLLTLEESVTYPGIIELEALALAIHREAGFDVPRHWMAEINGIPALAVERFDRDDAHTPVFTESLYTRLPRVTRLSPTITATVMTGSAGHSTGHPSPWSPILSTRNGTSWNGSLWRC